MSVETQKFVRPGRSKGLLEVFQKQYLLSLLVHKELRVRYRGSVLGMLWSYAKPAVQFLVFYFAIGMFMGMNRNIENYVIYMFAGVVAINFFTEIFNNDTRSVVWNTPLVKKIYLPRELFPVASAWVAFIHFIPQLVILTVGALIAGWRPGIIEFGVFIYAFFIVTVFALGLGLLAGALNVFFRDAENFVELMLMVATWSSPVLYKWSMVQHALGADSWLWTLYQLNPLTVVVELFHYVFWAPTLPADSAAKADIMPPDMWFWAGIAGVTAVVTLLIGELVFRKLDPRFAQEL
ncbi:ABC-2 type transporter [Gleimia coleocanis DSM 15436]|uniref:Transport permease protein n=1 Tax=Gleimia coleocanis DSM 15436 TaxID=525245 RepID=C0VZU1_9ACTO|nr:ABC transporter permease [Gleimia coleocanis]EEH63800.1 ABC-2 type transporter [Gleimia coleocanis DSM 15436]